MTVLTDGRTLESFLRERLTDAIERADCIDLDGVDRDHIDALADDICGSYGVERLELLRDKLAALPTETVKAGYPDPSGAMVIRPELIVTYRLPYTGSRELWNTVPNGKLVVISTDNPLGPVRVGGPDHLLISLRATDRSADQLKNDRAQVISSLSTKVGWANEQVDDWMDRLHSDVRRRLLFRVRLGEHGRALDEASDIPLYRVPAEEQVPIPVERKSLRPVQSTAEDAIGQPDPVMAEEIYADVVNTIEQMTLAMERTPTAAKLNEEEIRNLILFVLNANYRGAAAGEVFNGEGKTDILLRWDGANAFIGECKFWKGPRAFRDAIDQMLGYVSWRDTKAALIVFMRGGQPTEIMKKAKKELRDHETCESESPDGTATRGDYVLRSNRDKEQLISVALIGVVIPAPKEGATPAAS